MAAKVPEGGHGSPVTPLWPPSSPAAAARPRRRPLPPYRCSEQTPASCRGAELGRKSVPGGSGSTRRFLHPDGSRISPGRSRSLCFPALPGGRRRSAPGLLLRPLLLLSKPGPPREPGRRELVLGETPPPRLEEDFLSHTFSS